MKGIGGNTTATFQNCTISKNAIGEQVKSWADIQTIKGWLDMLSGDSSYTTYNAKLVGSTHVFVADYVELNSSIKPEVSRMNINGKCYDITYIDNPMEMESGSQLEIFLTYTGDD